MSEQAVGSMHKITGGQASRGGSGRGTGQARSTALFRNDDHERAAREEEEEWRELYGRGEAGGVDGGLGNLGLERLESDSDARLYQSVVAQQAEIDFKHKREVHQRICGNKSAHKRLVNGLAGKVTIPKP